MVLIPWLLRSYLQCLEPLDLAFAHKLAPSLICVLTVALVVEIQEVLVLQEQRFDTKGHVALVAEIRCNGCGLWLERAKGLSRADFFALMKFPIKHRPIVEGSLLTQPRGYRVFVVVRQAELLINCREVPRRARSPLVVASPSKLGGTDGKDLRIGQLDP